MARSQKNLAPVLCPFGHVETASRLWYTPLFPPSQRLSSQRGQIAPNTDDKVGGEAMAGLAASAGT